MWYDVYRTIDLYSGRFNMKGNKAKPFKLVVATNDKMKKTKEKLLGQEMGEPNLLINNMTCPDTMQGEARKEWDRITGLYKYLDMELLADLDSDVLEAYCNALAKYHEAIRHSRGQEVIRINGEPKINPWVKVSLDAENAMLKFGGLLLLDPVSRARVGLAKSKQVELDPIAAMLRGGKG